MNILFLREDDAWLRSEDFPTYHEAVLMGQRLAPGNFYVDTGSRCPTREEQLLLPPLDFKPRIHRVKPKTKLENFLANL